LHHYPSYALSLVLPLAPLYACNCATATSHLCTTPPDTSHHHHHQIKLQTNRPSHHKQTTPHTTHKPPIVGMGCLMKLNQMSHTANHPPPSNRQGARAAPAGDMGTGTGSFTRRSLPPSGWGGIGSNPSSPPACGENVASVPPDHIDRPPEIENSQGTSSPRTTAGASKSLSCGRHPGLKIASADLFSQQTSLQRHPSLRPPSPASVSPAQPSPASAARPASQPRSQPWSPLNAGRGRIDVEDMGRSLRFSKSETQVEDGCRSTLATAK
jgi:hypothetical protein